ncbi:MAG: glycoside hydrolase [Clostridia bacterium]|nr:glycoside hydrolase [Clostridia bacterium]
MKNTLICAGNETYSHYRIPGMTVTAKGTLLIYFEARRTMSDWANMDILLYRSEDGGESFSEPIVIAGGTEQFPTVNNPVCIAEPDGTLHFLYCRDYSVEGGDVFYRRSDDDGKTWSEPRNIMASTRPDYHNVIACGPGHGICTKNGMLLTPVWMVPKSANVPVRAHNPAQISTLYSLDHGDTWQLGEIIPASSTVPDPNETQAAELSDGSIYLNVRTTGSGCRAYTRSKTGYSGWDDLQRDETLIDPTCFGSVVSAGGKQLGFVNCCSKTERQNLVCRYSSDGGKTWEKSITVEPGDAGYADIAVMPDGTVCVLYEQRFGECDRLARFRMDELK